MQWGIIPLSLCIKISQVLHFPYHICHFIEIVRIQIKVFKLLRLPIDGGSIFKPKCLNLKYLKWISVPTILGRLSISKPSKSSTLSTLQHLPKCTCKNYYKKWKNGWMTSIFEFQDSMSQNNYLSLFETTHSWWTKFISVLGIVIVFHKPYTKIYKQYGQKII